MLPLIQRLPPNEAKTLKNKASSGGFSLYFGKKKGEKPRFMVVVGANVHKKANLRNNLKRHIREALRSMEDAWADAVVIASPRAGKLSGQEVKEEIKNLFKKI